VIARRDGAGSARRRGAELVLLVLAAAIVVLAYIALGISIEGDVPADLALYGGGLVVVAAGAHLVLRLFARAADPVLLPAAFLLNGLGVVMVRRIDIALAIGQEEVSPRAPDQALWTLVGVAAFCAVVVALRDHRVLDQYRYLFGVGAVVLLLLPSLPFIGREINGARIWLDLGLFSFQPGELAKIALAIFFAAYLAEKRELLGTAVSRLGPLRAPPVRSFAPVAVVWVASLLVLIFQRDLGLSLLLFGMFLVLLYVATERGLYLVGGLTLFAAGAFAAYQAFSHVRQRIDIWLNPFADYEGDGYQLVQSLFAMGDGGVFGVGLGQGRPDFIPLVNTDFIFSTFAEELGLLGATGLLLCYFLISGRAFSIAVRCRDEFGTLLAACLGIVFSLQTFIIIGGVTTLIPLSGMTLPLVSYGGSALLSNYVLVGLLLRISAAPEPERPHRPAEAWSPEASTAGAPGGGHA
jgi:cell division protein FtsW (lipid II flippase)